MSAAKPLRIHFPQKQIDAILARVRAYPWGDMPQIPKDAPHRWIYGTDMEYLKELCAYWVDGYDWRQCEARLQQCDHHKADIQGLGVHYILARSANPKARWLLLTHGWPGSVLEFMDVLDPLANPQKHGGALEDGMHVVCPSLPGYGFSDKPPAPLGPRSVAAMWDELMRTVIGAPDYIAQGGDWGAITSSFLGLRHAAPKAGGCAAIHLNMLGLRPTDFAPRTDDERAWFGKAAAVAEAETAYLRLQATKPQTLSYAMMDSPVGACAWIVEKFHGWGDLRAGTHTSKGAGPKGAEIERAFSKDFLLSNVMLYLLTETFGTASWIYRGLFEEGGPVMPEGETVAVPTGIANFADPFMDFPPRSMVERGYRIVHWQDYDRFGHFAALEAGPVFVREVQQFVRQLKG